LQSHSFILNIYIAPLQKNYSEALPTPAWLNKAVLRWEKNPGERVLLKMRSSEGRPFQVEGPTTEKARICLVQWIIGLNNSGTMGKQLFPFWIILYWSHSLNLGLIKLFSIWMISWSYSVFYLLVTFVFISWALWLFKFCMVFCVLLGFRSDYKFLTESSQLNPATSLDDSLLHCLPARFSCPTESEPLWLHWEMR